MSDDGVPTTASNPSPPKCVCGWKNCRAYQKMFHQASHPVLNGVVKLKFAKDHPESMALKESIDRTLRVTKSEWKASGRTTAAGQPQQVCRYHVARHHWTEKHMKKYLADPKGYSFLKPFSVHGARKYLFTLDKRETYQRNKGSSNSAEEALYLQCPNVPKEVVKAEYTRCKEEWERREAEAAVSDEEDFASPPPLADPVSEDFEDEEEEEEEEELPPPPQPRAAARQQNHRHAQQQQQQYHQQQPKEDSQTASTTKSSSHRRDRSVAGEPNLLKQKEDENVQLKTQLESMKDQLAYLHDMVRRLQEEHFDAVSVKSKSRTNNNSNNRSSNKSYSNHNSTRPSLAGQGGSMRSMRSGAIPREIELGEDEEDDVDGWTQTAEDWTDQYDDVERDRDEEEDDLGRSVDDDEISRATFKVTYKAERRPSGGSVGGASRATSIVSASKSIRTLPREVELEDDEDDSDSRSSLEDDFDHRSVTSSYHASNVSVDNDDAIGGSSHMRRRPSTVPRVPGSGDNSSAHKKTNVKQPTRTSSSKRGGRRSSINSTTDKSIDDPVSSGTYNVESMTVTDPYGEKGTYTGSISHHTNMPHGYGRLEYDRAGRWYEGDWKHGRWTGQGKLSNGDGDYYEGGLKNDHKHGWGRMVFADGRTFEGEYVNGQMIEGTMTYQDGSTYAGSWVDGMRHGTGRCVFTDHSIYEGEFREGEFFGMGKMTWSDGGHYIGEWWNGEMHGHGKEVRPDNTIRHEGQWSKGQPIRR